MADKARVWTDKKLSKMEKEISDIYKKSAKDVYKKWDSFMKEADSAISEYQKAYEEAKKLGDKELIKSTGRKLSEVKRQQTLQSSAYKEMLNRTTKELANVNQTALAYVNDQVPSVYAKNFVQVGEDLKSLEPKFKGMTDKSIKSIINEDVIKRQITDGTIETPFMKSQKFLSISKDMRWNTKQINSSVLQGILQGEPMDKIAKRLLPVMHNNESASIRNARTIVTGAENAGRKDSYTRLEEEGFVMKKVWIATGDDRTRESHLEMDGQEVDIDEPFIAINRDGTQCELDYPADPTADAEQVYNCFVGDTMVTANTEIMRTYKHEYEGNLITIKTAGGIQFTCTPNHPILTGRGWIGANALNNGDNILITFACDNRIFGFDPNIKHIFTRFDTLHKSGNECVTERATNLNVNFHGDIPTSDVEIIAKKSFLRHDWNTSGSKGINKLLLESSDMPFTRKRTFMQHFRRVLFSTSGIIRGKCKTFSFFWRSLLHAKEHGIRPIAWGYSGRFKPIYNNRSCDIKILRECLDGFSGIICTDKIINIDIQFSHCDVFNLQSKNGYYFVNSIISNDVEKNNGIVAISHNCRCSMKTHIVGFKKDDGDIEEVDYNKQGESAHERSIEAEKERRRND